MSGTEAPRFVMVATEGEQSYYPEDAFVAAFNEAFLGLVAVAIPAGATPRKAARAIRSMKGAGRHKAVLKAALDRLCRTESVPADAVARSGGSVVAAFPV